jgi:hypothetical protein
MRRKMMRETPKSPKSPKAVKSPKQKSPKKSPPKSPKRNVNFGLDSVHKINKDLPANVHLSREDKPKKEKKERGCTEQYNKKYTTRPSPPYPANECKGYTKIGNDGQFWKSTFQRRSPSVGDVYTWKLM